MVSNPKWYDQFSINPYNNTYPSWDKLLSKNNKEIRDILKLVVSWPQNVESDSVDLEVWKAEAYYRPTPIGGWKIIPHEKFMDMWTTGLAVLAAGLFQTTNIGPCATHSWLTMFFYRYWVSQCAVFEIAVDVIHHQFNLAITANPDRSVNIIHCDLLWHEPPMIITPGVIPEKFKSGRIYHIYMP